MTKPFTVRDVASICHEANRRLCFTLNDKSQAPWRDAPEWQRDSATEGVLYHIRHPEDDPEGSHRNWMAHKLATGWRYGPVKDEEAKTHPCMVPFDELPPAHRAKDYLFKAIVNALEPFIDPTRGE